MRLAFICSGEPENLKYLKNNRELLDTTLRKYGWEVINTPLLNIGDLNTKLQEYPKNIVNEFFFFYTGHGDVTSEQQMLRLKLNNSKVYINDILDSIFEYINPKQQVVVIDACYSGTIKGINFKKNIEFLSSSQAIEQSYESDNLKNSLFSHAFCEAFSSLSGDITLRDVSQYINSKNNKQESLPMSIGLNSIILAKRIKKQNVSTRLDNLLSFLEKMGSNDFSLSEKK